LSLPLAALRFRFDDPGALGVAISANTGLGTVEIQALSQNVRVGPRVLPTLHTALLAAARSLGVNQPMTAFVLASPEANAHCLSDREDRRILMFVTSTLVRQLSPSELRFLFGHELGHVLFGHFRYPPARPTNAETPVPARVLELHQYAELSADRAGWLAAGDMEVAIRALLKIASGLGDDELEIDVSDFLDQAHELREGPGDETILFATHPPLNLRARALLRAESIMRAAIEGQSVDAELGECDRLIQRDIDLAACGVAGTGVAERGRIAAFWRAALHLCRDGEFSRGDQNTLLAEFGEDRVSALRRLLNEAGSRASALSKLQEKTDQSRAEIDRSPTLVERVYNEILARLRQHVADL